MHVLSFRDLASKHAQGIIGGEVIELSPAAGAAVDWANPASLEKRLAAGQARRLGVDEAKAVFRDQRVCFVVHGFNVDRDHGYAGYGAMAAEMLGGPVLSLGPVVGADVVVPVLWPGDWHIPAINYPFEMGDVRATGEQFARFLRGAAAEADSFTFVSHSLGARVVLEAVSRAVLSGPTPPFELAVLAAAAADQDELDNPRYREGVRAVRRIVVVSSPTDEVLGLAFPAGNIVEAALWRGEKARTKALGRQGPKPLKAGSTAAGKVRWFQIDAPAPHKHGDYFPAPWAGGAPHPGWSGKRQAFGQFLHAVLCDDAVRPPWPVEKPPPG
jgi:hypothetical protein